MAMETKEKAPIAMTTAPPLGKQSLVRRDSVNGFLRSVRLFVVMA
jgi:hypothetical protein